jgi:cell division protein FtsI (penicillin-binding protein 3)
MENDNLAGENRELLMQKVAGGIYMPVNDNSEFGSKPGLDIYTTLDINLQDITESSLLKSVSEFNADHGSAILMNVQTGEIKAIANIGKTKNGEYKEIFNYAINELNEPGSVMKLASVMALLDNGYSDEETQIDLENGQKKYFDLVLKDDHIVMGSVSLKKAFELSSNVGISKEVYKHFKNKKDEFYSFLEKVHLTQPYGIGLQGESSPILNSPKQWSGVTLPWLSIGYEIRMTPLQVLGLYAAVANNGKLMKPYIIREIRDNDNVVEEFQPVILNSQICKPKTIEIVRRMLEGVVDSGTASNIRNVNYKIAGKTGTNLLSNGKFGFKQKQYQASFVGYFPANNPVYACIVVINKPDVNIGYHGSQCAAPVFKSIADRLYTTDIDIHPRLAANEKKSLRLNSFQGINSEIEKIADYFNWNALKSSVRSDWGTVTTSNNHIIIRPSFVYSKNRMPNVVAMNLKDAVYLLESIGLQVYVEGKGKIKSQSLRAGDIVFKGTPVKIILG